VIVSCFNNFPVSLYVKTRRKNKVIFASWRVNNIHGFLLQVAKGFQDLEELRERQGSQDLQDHLDLRVPLGLQDSPDRLGLQVVLGLRDFQEDVETPALVDL